MITPRMIEILNFINENGQTNVMATPRLLKQGGAVYERVWKLENLCCIKCIRTKGFPTKYTITDIGIEILNQSKIKK